jgi:Tol biopolymer transport system component
MPASAQTSSGAIGIFEGRTDIGEVVRPGVAEYDATSKSYRVTAAGENMWSTKDAFYFLWQEVSGDIEISADVAFPQEGGRPHRKAALILKQDMDADGVYADAALHGSGMAALQYRRTKGASTQDIELNIDMPRRVRIVKRGDEITMFLSMRGEPLHQAGASIKLHFEGRFYAGIGVCSHNKDGTETAVFSNVELKKPDADAPADKLVLFSALQTIQTEDNYRRSMMVRTEMGHIGSANWTKDGQTLYFDREGRIEKIAVLGATPESVEIGPHLWCDSNHGLSPDNKLLAVSCGPTRGPGMSIYVVSLDGRGNRRVTHGGVVEFHGWSPDGTMIAFAGTRHGHRDVYTVPVVGGGETRLTSTGANDGPDFGPDGAIYFNSDRSGAMQIWRMNADGTHAEQLTHDDTNDWFPHVSADGKQMVYLSCTKAIVGQPANTDVSLRLMDISTGQSRVLVDLLGGEGTINAPSWSPDNHHLAFTGYEMLSASADGTEFVMVAPRPDIPSK